MSEQELKLNVPVEAQSRVEQAVQRAKYSQIQLRALYFDTPSRALVQARIALRLRLEGNQWVQTLKMPGEHSLSRVEINQDRPEATLDLSVYTGTPAGEILSNLSEPLQVCYETNVLRQLRDIRTPSGVVELAFDRGLLRAGKLELPISEVEFELKRGHLEAVFEVGRTWQQRFGLILDFRSKAERGDRLAQLAQALDAVEDMETHDDASRQQQAALRAQRVADFWKPRGAEIVSLVSAVKLRDSAQVLAVVTAECLEQIVRNTAVLCEVDTAGICQAATPEHIHQLRVGIRRLRSAWSFFDGLTQLPSLELREQIKEYFSHLGGTRDEDVLKGSVLPAIAAAGLPPLVLPVSPHQSSGTQLVASAGFQRWLLDMLALCTIPAEPLMVKPVAPVSVSARGDADHDEVFIFPHAPPLPQKPPLKPLLIKKLKKWHRRIVQNGVAFRNLNIEQQHALRKQCKKLRYALQFCEYLLPAANLQPYRKQLAVVQDILGEMNDLYVALPLFESLKMDQPQAWFACGWIQARQATLTDAASKAFRRLAKAKLPWD
ncbi:MAG: CHAD domain-containing protein [Zwartia sp.]|uniref:CYTH and CHAD domain-containing protein n=3 Tax=Zwartia sp. TaxID=2978004 RepID=UPI003C76D8A9